MSDFANLPRLSTAHTYSQLSYKYEPSAKTLISIMRPTPRPCFTTRMLEELAFSEQLLESHEGWIDHQGTAHRVEYLVSTSAVVGVFNLGGDLDAFAKAIATGNRAQLERYGHTCIAGVARRCNGFGCGITTITLVEGRALGGGFEAALTGNVIVAEEQASFGFPELLFSLFPGMGAMSLLTRRIGVTRAREIVESAREFPATEMHARGVIDHVVKVGRGMDTVRALITARRAQPHVPMVLDGRTAIAAAARIASAPSTAEMTEIVNLWVDCAMRVRAIDVRMMQRLVRGQDRLVAVPV